TIVSRGKAKAEIVVESQAETPLAFAAQELQRYIKEMSGAELPVGQVASVKQRSIILLTSQRFQPENGALKDPKEEDRYRLNIDARTLRIEGASPREG